MEVYTNNLPSDGKKYCVALGNFDGLHRGHQSIILSASEFAKKNNLKMCMYTFKVHPSEIIGNRKKILTDNAEKTSLAQIYGCDCIFFEDFNEVRHMSPDEFCRSILRDKLRATHVFCGENYRFGYQGIGDTGTLKTELEKLNIGLTVMPFVYNNDNIISSTIIRESITSGDVEYSSKLLGHYYTVSGTVVHGKHLGRTLGFPTVNIPIPENKIVPKFGVYITECLLDGFLYKSISNIGVRPTVDSETSLSHVVNCETYLFDYCSDAYGKEITLYFHKKIRNEIKFSEIAFLKKQIEKDVYEAREYFENIKQS